MTIDPKTLNEIEAALARATPGPWASSYEPTSSDPPYDETMPNGNWVVENDAPPVGTVIVTTTSGLPHDADAIALIRNHAAAIIAEARTAARLREVLGALVDAAEAIEALRDEERRGRRSYDRGAQERREAAMVAYERALQECERELGRRK